MSILDDTHHDGQQARDRFGGTDRAAVFFGWLTTNAMTVLLGGVATALAAALATVTDPSSDEAGTLGVAGAIVLTVVLVTAYSVGGYVAGRMCRFDGGRQGMGVWLIGLMTTLAAFGAGIAVDRECRVLHRVDLSRAAVPSDLYALGALVAAIILASTLLGAMAGGALGQRYHAKVDRVRFP